MIWFLSLWAHALQHSLYYLGYRLLSLIRHPNPPQDLWTCYPLCLEHSSFRPVSSILYTNDLTSQRPFLTSPI
jgi:hypothetical protein